MATMTEAQAMGSLMRKIAEDAEARGYERGQQNALRIELGSTGYGSGQHAIFVIYGKSKRELRKRVAEMHWRHTGDNPGQAYMGTAEIIRYHHDDAGGWTAICIGSTYYDV